MFYASDTEYNEDHCGGYVSYLQPLWKPCPLQGAFGKQQTGDAAIPSFSQSRSDLVPRTNPFSVAVDRDNSYPAECAACSTWWEFIYWSRLICRVIVDETM